MNRRSVDKQPALRLVSPRDEILTEVAEVEVPTGRQVPGVAPIAMLDPAPRSWRQGRTMISGPAILMMVSAAQRRRLIAEYVDLGGAWPVSSSSDNATLLDLLASRLPDPSHALSLCRMEAALTRASLGAAVFVEPEYRSVQERTRREMQARIEHEAWGCIERALQGPAATEPWDHIERSAWDSVESAVWDGIMRDTRFRLECDAWQIIERSARNRIERGLYASLVWFHAEPGSVLRALHGEPAPPVGKSLHPLLFGPGVPNLCRVATPEDVILWASLPTDDTAPELVERLLAEGVVSYTD